MPRNESLLKFVETKMKIREDRRNLMLPCDRCSDNKFGHHWHTRGPNVSNSATVNKQQRSGQVGVLPDLTLRCELQQQPQQHDTVRFRCDSANESATVASQARHGPRTRGS